MIKISQKPNSEKGFGFTIRGGKEFAQPVVVDKVTLGKYSFYVNLYTQSNHIEEYVYMNSFKFGLVFFISAIYK